MQNRTENESIVNNSPEHSKSSAKPHSCCAPRTHRDEQVPEKLHTNSPSFETESSTSDAARSVVSLPAATFLMGTDYAKGFPEDGEGPVRPVSLSAFEIDTF